MSKKQILYATLCIVGTILPYSQLVPFLYEHGFNARLMLQQLFANKISSFFGLDVIISSIVLLIFMSSEGFKLKVRHLWACFASLLLVGVSLGLPLFLLMRQRKLEELETTIGRPAS